MNYMTAEAEAAVEELGNPKAQWSVLPLDLERNVAANVPVRSESFADLRFRINNYAEQLVRNNRYGLLRYGGMLLLGDDIDVVAFLDIAAEKIASIQVSGQPA